MGLFDKIKKSISDISNDVLGDSYDNDESLLDDLDDDLDSEDLSDSTEEDSLLDDLGDSLDLEGITDSIKEITGSETSALLGSLFGGNKKQPSQPKRPATPTPSQPRREASHGASESLLDKLGDSLDLGDITDSIKEITGSETAALLGSLFGGNKKQSSQPKKSAAPSPSPSQSKPNAPKPEASHGASNTTDIESKLTFKAGPVKPAQAKVPASDNARPLSMNTNLAQILVKSFYPQVEADSDGDLVVRFDAKADAAVKFKMYVYVHSDRLTFDMIVRFINGEPTVERTMPILEKRYPEITIEKNENVIRFKRTFRAEGFTTDDVESILIECQSILELLSEASKNCVYGSAAEYEMSKPKVMRFRFHTRQIEKWIELQDNVTYTTDDEGDVRADHTTARNERIDWFVWYYISPEKLSIDAGYNGDYEWAIQSQMADQFNSTPQFKGITAVLNNRGNIRLKADIEAGDGTTYDSITEEWVNIHYLLETFFANLATINEQYEGEKARRARAEAARRSQESDSYESYESSSSSSRSSSSSSSSSSRRSGPSEAQIAKQEERERKAAEKKKKDDEIRKIDDTIKKRQDYIRGCKALIADWSKTPQQRRDSRQAIADQRAAIERANNEIAELKKKKQRIKDS